MKKTDLRHMELYSTVNKLASLDKMCDNIKSQTFFFFFNKCTRNLGKVPTALTELQHCNITEIQEHSCHEQCIKVSGYKMFRKERMNKRRYYGYIMVPFFLLISA